MPSTLKIQDPVTDFFYTQEKRMYVVFILGWGGRLNFALNSHACQSAWVGVGRGRGSENLYQGAL